MKNLVQTLEEQGIHSVFEEIGLNFSQLFSKGMDPNPYRKHTWLVKENADFLVVNAIPSPADQDHLFWEEWFRHQNTIYHHILSLWKPADFQSIFKAPESDSIHPEPCFGKTWYCIEDPDMSPWLLRR